MDDQEDINLVYCDDHGMVPWSIVCIHLYNGESREWIGQESQIPGAGYDWVCPKCENLVDTLHPGSPQLNDLCVVCIHHVREIRKRYDPNFTELPAPSNN